MYDIEYSIEKKRISIIFELAEQDLKKYIDSTMKFLTKEKLME